MKYAFNEKGHGAIVNSSRGIMCAWKKTGGDGHDFQEAARNAAIAMKEDIARFVTIQTCALSGEPCELQGGQYGRDTHPELSKLWGGDGM